MHRWLYANFTELLQKGCITSTKSGYVDEFIAMTPELDEAPAEDRWWYQCSLATNYSWEHGYDEDRNAQYTENCYNHAIPANNKWIKLKIGDTVPDKWPFKNMIPKQ